ncbi:MAG TPA: acetyl-CoA carboxylase biotin carboxylase subunit, partial [Sphingomonadales bacterium]|nr:acetyl-CoA carboxylase biotin carboxylase subunit [Sphingomonadales bacterium]
STSSFLAIEAMLDVARRTGADAIHPGYGFLSENADFAERVENSGFVFIGPTAASIRTMGDKIAAKASAEKLGLPVVPGSGAIKSLEEAKAAAAGIGYPVLIKAAAGGGGRGMKVVREEAELENAMRAAKTEALAAFGEDSIYLEKFLTKPRHIEFQVIGDAHGRAIHLGERDCSLQRRHQKILEETPSPALTSVQRDGMGEKVAKAIRDMGYLGLGTVEFLYEKGEFYFIEMNTRLQVEHPVTEMITGIDLVREQIRVAAGLPLSYRQKDIEFHGHAIECRINAEDPLTFAPSPGKVTQYHPPGGLDVRVDSALYDGYVIPPYYDSMIAKVIVHGLGRAECLMRLRRALEEYVIGGIKHTVPLHQLLIENPDFVNGDYNILWLEKFLKNLNR